MAFPFACPVSLTWNELQNASFQVLSIAPSITKEGAFYYDDTENVPKYYNGTSWASFGSGGSDTNTTYTFSSGTTNGAFSVTPSDSTAQSVSIYGLNNAAYKDIDTTIIENSTSTKLPITSAVVEYVATAISANDAMHYKGTVGTNGDMASLPTSNVRIGDMYKISSAGTYNSIVCKVGDMFIATAITPIWSYVPSGDDSSVNSYDEPNPELIQSNGVCTWTVTHNLGKRWVHVDLYKKSTGEMIGAEVTASSTTTTTITIYSNENILAETYHVVIVV